MGAPSGRGGSERWGRLQLDLSTHFEHLVGWDLEESSRLLGVARQKRKDRQMTAGINSAGGTRAKKGFCRDAGAWSRNAPWPS